MPRKTSSKLSTNAADDAVSTPRAQLSETAYTQIREAIQRGDYTPGDRLLEDEIAQRLNFSRTPVREALRRLEDEGLLIHQPHRGMTVAKLDYQMIVELFVVRDVLEGAAARMSARLASDTELEVLANLARREADVVDSAEGMALHNRRFHATIYMMAHNRYLLKTLSALSDSLAVLSTTSFSLPERRTAAMEEHRAIADAIVARDPERAEAAARAHIHSAHKTRLQMLAEGKG